MKYFFLFFSFSVIYLSVVSGGSDNYFFINEFHYFMGWNAESIHQGCMEYWGNDSLLMRCYYDLTRDMDTFYKLTYLLGYSFMMFQIFKGGLKVKLISLFFVVFLCFIHFGYGGLGSVGFIFNLLVVIVLFSTILLKYFRGLGLIR